MCLLLLPGCQRADLETGSQMSIDDSLQESEEILQSFAAFSQSFEAVTPVAVDVPLSATAIGLPSI